MSSSARLAGNLEIQRSDNEIIDKERLNEALYIVNRGTIGGFDICSVDIDYQPEVKGCFSHEGRVWKYGVNWHSVQLVVAGSSTDHFNFIGIYQVSDHAILSIAERDADDKRQELRRIR